MLGAAASALTLALGLALGLGGCASKTDWSLTSARSCAPKAAPRICVIAAPDYGHVIELGDAELLPGECAAATEDARGGLLDVQTRDREGQVRGRWIRARRGQTTIVEIEADGRPRRAARPGCDGIPVDVSAGGIPSIEH